LTRTALSSTLAGQASSRRSWPPTPSQWPPTGPRNGEYFADDGTILRGRAEIEKDTPTCSQEDGQSRGRAWRSRSDFASRPRHRRSGEGYFKVRKGEHVRSPPARHRPSRREGAKWLMALVREWPSEEISAATSTADRHVGSQRDDTEGPHHLRMVGRQDPSSRSRSPSSKRAGP